MQPFKKLHIYKKGDQTAHYCQINLSIKMRLHRMACTYYALCIKCTKTFAGISGYKLLRPSPSGCIIEVSYSCCVSMWECMGVGVSVGVCYKLVGIFKTKPLTQLVSWAQHYVVCIWWQYLSRIKLWVHYDLKWLSRETLLWARYCKDYVRYWLQTCKQHAQDLNLKHIQIWVHYGQN